MKEIHVLDASRGPRGPPLMWGWGGGGFNFIFISRDSMLKIIYSEGGLFLLNFFLWRRVLIFSRKSIWIFFLISSGPPSRLLMVASTAKRWMKRIKMIHSIGFQKNFQGKNQEQNGLKMANFTTMDSSPECSLSICPLCTLCIICEQKVKFHSCSIKNKWHLLREITWSDDGLRN